MFTETLELERLICSKKGNWDRKQPRLKDTNEAYLQRGIMSMQFVELNEAHLQRS